VAELKAETDAVAARAEADMRILDILTTSGYKRLRDLADATDSQIRGEEVETK
jgi:hypothetical protein